MSGQYRVWQNLLQLPNDGVCLSTMSDGNLVNISCNHVVLYICNDIVHSMCTDICTLSYRFTITGYLSSVCILTLKYSHLIEDRAY